ncbi:hypothetical protein CK203_100613 [Vitis vinifera]|uniref:Uncharacterized protein n=1 Tax=Vitis vinifera TaxID=29760 RepID=A0A438FII4_VITVI|nr:hypothetical protein CK203_100613 [Vitis vinifera]
MGGNEASAFDMGYARWLDEYQRLINDLRSVVNSHVGIMNYAFLSIATWPPAMHGAMMSISFE